MKQKEGKNKWIYNYLYVSKKMSCIESPEVIIYKPNSYIIEILIQRVHPRPTESEFLGDKGQQLAFLMVCGPVNFFNKKNGM